MDIDDILLQAKHNVKKANKKLNEADEEMQKEKARKIAAWKRQKEIEREDLAKKKPPPPPPKAFKIPKKKEELKTSVDSSKIAAFLHKKEEKKKQEDERKLREKEELIKLRIESQGGKANKKIAKHFGSNPVDLQMKYGKEEHIDLLIKQQQRDEEEIRKISNFYKEGISMSKQKQSSSKPNVLKSQQDSKVRKVQSSLSNTTKHVSRIDKASSSKLSTQYSAASNKNSVNTRKSVIIKRKAPPVDFDALLKQAEKNRDLSPSKLDSLPTPSPSPPPPPKRPSYEDTRLKKNGVRVERTNGHISKTVPAKMHLTQNGSSSSKINSIYKEKPEVNTKPDILAKKPNGVIKKPIEPIAEKPTYDPNRPKRILPGDIRYQGPPPSSKPGSSGTRAPLQKAVFSKPANVVKNPNRPTSSSSMTTVNINEEFQRRIAELEAEREQLIAKVKAQKSGVPMKKPLVEQARNDGHKKPIASSSSLNQSQRKEQEYKIIAKMKHDERFKAEQMRQMAMKKKPQSQSHNRNHHHHSYNSLVKDSSESATEDDEYNDDNYDDEYDSDLADFIDDTELDDFQQVDLEETLKMINRNYDKKKWKMRERMIDDRQMTARFADIEREERRSAKLGLVEDMMEARKGKSRAI